MDPKSNSDKIDSLRTVFADVIDQGGERLDDDALMAIFDPTALDDIEIDPAAIARLKSRFRAERRAAAVQAPGPVAIAGVRLLSAHGKDGAESRPRLDLDLTESVQNWISRWFGPEAAMSGIRAMPQDDETRLQSELSQLAFVPSGWTRVGDTRLILRFAPPPGQPDVRPTRCTVLCDNQTVPADLRRNPKHPGFFINIPFARADQISFIYSEPRALDVTLYQSGTAPRGHRAR